jgi:hypothetical protein
MVPGYVLQLLFGEKSTNFKKTQQPPKLARKMANKDFEFKGNFRFMYVCLTKFKKNQILLNKIGHQSILTTKLITG